MYVSQGDKVVNKIIKHLRDKQLGLEATNTINLIVFCFKKQNT